ncbi:type II secretion system F family protein [Vibrio atlanticus]|uniref:type II secretion system F family protein n=1 Tax=Vibrio atlanticus TaxID=693153 RepID=UPI00354EBFB5
MASSINFSNVGLFFAWAGVAFGLLLIFYWLVVCTQKKHRIAALAKHHRLADQSKEAEIKLNRWLTPMSTIFVTSESDIAVRFANAGVCWFIEVSSESWIAIAAGWAMVVIVMPDLVLSSMAKNRQRRISRQMPYLIDLMAICVQTGMTIEASMKYLSIEMKSFDKELSSLLEVTNQRARLVGMENALEELYRKVPSPEVRSFVMTLTQSIQHGSSIYNVLTTLAGDIREVQMLELEEEIGKLAAKMSIPLIVFILIPIVFVIAAPGVMRMMLNV